MKKSISGASTFHHLNLQAQWGEIYNSMFLALRISRLFWKTECDQFLLHCSEFCSSSSDDLPYFQAPLGFFHLQSQTKTGGKVSPFLSKALNRSFSCLSPLALKLEMRPFEPCSYTLSWQRGLLYYSPHIFSRNVAHSSASPYMKTLNLT